MTARVGPREARPLDGEVLAPDAAWVWRYAERVTPSRQLFGFALCSHYGAVALWVGNPGRRLMGFVIEHIDRVSAALDEMARLDEEMGLR
jgi:hypothetical protein